jgi:hypothetical protein
VFACGRDPYFPAWPDVLQLNAFNPGLRRAVIETISSIADQCDGIRCDMAMLLLNDIFERTRGARAGAKPTDDYWTTVIPAIIAWCWIKDDARALIVVNYGPESAQARVHVPWDELRGTQWRLDDALSGENCDRDGSEMRDSGLYVDLGPWQCHVFQVRAR